jgi:hypothetical protein
MSRGEDALARTLYRAKAALAVRSQERQDLRPRKDVRLAMGSEQQSAVQGGEEFLRQVLADGPVWADDILAQR